MFTKSTKGCDGVKLCEQKLCDLNEIWNSIEIEMLTDEVCFKFNLQSLYHRLLSRRGVVELHQRLGHRFNFLFSFLLVKLIFSHMRCDKLHWNIGSVIDHQDIRFFNTDS